MKKITYHGVKGERITSNSESYEVNRKKDFIQTMMLYITILIMIAGVTLWLKQL
jgi:hypothetical protein